MWFLSVWGEDINQVFGSLSHKLNLAGNMAMSVIAKVAQGFAAGLGGWSTPPRTAITDLPQNLQESRIKSLFSVSLPAFASIYIVTGSFPKERTSCEAGFDSHLPPSHFSFISGITGLLYIQGRLHINAICLFMTIPHQSFRHGDRLTRQNHTFLSSPECSCLRWHIGNGSQPLPAGGHQPWKPPKLPHFHSHLRSEALESKMACKQG